MNSVVGENNLLKAANYEGASRDGPMLCYASVRFSDSSTKLDDHFR